MAIPTREIAHAFAPGADLWALPLPLDSNVFKKVDWYLNFQVTRAGRHESQEVSALLRTIINESQLPSFTPKKQAMNDLLLAADDHLPAHWVVVTPPLEAPEQWVTHLHNMWEKFKKPNFRVFLPANISTKEFEQHWPEKKVSTIELIPYDS